MALLLFFCSRPLTFFSKLIFTKISFRNIVRVLYSFDPDQTPHSVDPDLGRNCLKMLSADVQQNENVIRDFLAMKEIYEIVLIQKND